MPRPGTPVFHRDWSAHNRPTAGLQCTAACVITRPSTEAGVFDPVTGKTTLLPPVTVYTGPCRVQSATSLQPSEEVFAGESVQVVDYRVTLPWPVDGLQVDDRVQVTESLEDPSLLAVELRVRQIVRGTLAWQRDLICDETQAVQADEGV